MVGGLCDVSSMYCVVVRVAVLAVAGLHLKQEVLQSLRIDLHQPKMWFFGSDVAHYASVGKFKTSKAFLQR